MLVWQSTLAITVIDLTLIAALSYALANFLHNRRVFVAARAATSSVLVALGLGLGVLYFAMDLFVLYGLPLLAGAGRAGHAVEVLHGEISWLTLALAMALFAAGISLFYPQLGNLIARLQTARDDLSADVQFRNEELTRELAERKRAQEAEHQQAEIIDQSYEAIITTDLKGLVTSWNRGAERLFGYTAGEVLGRPLRPLVGAEGDLEWETRRADSIERGRIGFEDERSNKSGGRFDCEISLTVLRDGDGNPTGIATFCRDITERRRADAELRQAKIEAEAANEAKSEFLSSMSHELRTPLNAILGYGQLLDLDQDLLQSSKQRQAVTAILAAGHQLLGLIDMVLELAKIESGHVLLSPTTMQPTEGVLECLKLVESMAEGAGISLHHRFSEDQVPNILADYFRFKQILLNLLSNAIKYNRDGGAVEVFWARTPGDALRISVRDTGRGIAVNDRSLIFEPFSRLGLERSEIEGTGIGLTITKQLVEMMGGSVGFDSEPGAGSTFWFELPLATETAARTAEPAHGEDAWARDFDWDSLTGTVLYIEDNPSNRYLMENILDRFPNLELLTAESGEAGLKLARDRALGLILLDLNLLDMDGYDVLAELRKGRKTKNIPVIAVTAKAMTGDLELGQEAGFADYVTKPIRLAQLAESIHNVLADGPIAP